MIRSRRRWTGDLDEIVRSLGPHIRRAEWLNFQCPYHHGSKKNFGVNTVSGAYSCFACGASGPLSDLLRYIRTGGQTRGLTALLDRHPTDIPIPPSRGRGKRSRGVPWGQGGPDPEKGLHLTASTAGTGLAMRAVGTGVAITPDRFDDMYYHIHEAPDSLLKKKGLAYLKRRNVDPTKIDCGFIDGYEGRIVFPFRQHGRAVYFQGRAILDIPLKTKNIPEGDGWSGKRNVLWNHDSIIDRSDIAVCEGVFDAYSVWAASGVASTCLLGSTISRRQAELIKKVAPKRVYVFLDADAMFPALDVARKLADNKQSVWVVVWNGQESGKDPNEIEPSEINDLLVRSVRFTPQTEIRLRFEYA